MNQDSTSDPGDPDPGDDAKGGPGDPSNGQGPPAEHLAHLARLVEQGLPPALRGDGTGFD